MARIRTVKPEFWTDERVGECSVSARLLFVATWNFADDHGGLARSAKQLKAQAFPYDAIDCEPLIQELLRVGLLVEYQVDGKNYLHINKFTVHQKIEKPARPRQPVYEESMRTHRGLTENSPSSAVSSLEGNGREGKGRESVSAISSPRRTKQKPVSRETPPHWFLDFKLAYPDRAGDQNWRGALRAANARLTEGHTVEEFLDGAGRYGEFCKATGKLRTEFVQQASRFLGPGKPFLERWALPLNKTEVRLAGNLESTEEFMQRTEVM